MSCGIGHAAMSSATQVAVIGAGNVGCAVAAHLALRGSEVRLFNRTAERLEPIRAAGGIAVTGEVEGFASVSVLTDSLGEAVAGAEVVVVAVPTASLPAYAAGLVEAITEDQVIWLNPGHTGGALYLAAEFERATRRGARRLCQLTTASHISRMMDATTVRVFLLSRASVAAFPSRDLDECHQRLDALLPGQFGKADTVLEADLSNVNAILHPSGMVCNAGWIEATSGEFGFYADGTTPAVGRVMDAIDGERLALAQRLQVPAAPFAELFHRLGFIGDDVPPAGSAHDAVDRSEMIHPIRSPPALDHRYLHEDVGWGLVPWMHLAAAIGCPTPTITALTQLASVINGVDYPRQGLTLERMGLAGKSAEEIRAYVGA
jgi:opine dehydrogenase